MPSLPCCVSCLSSSVQQHPPAAWHVSCAFWCVRSTLYHESVDNHASMPQHPHQLHAHNVSCWACLHPFCNLSKHSLLHAPLAQGSSKGWSFRYLSRLAKLMLRLYCRNLFAYAIITLKTNGYFNRHRCLSFKRPYLAREFSVIVYWHLLVSPKLFWRCNLFSHYLLHS